MNFESLIGVGLRRPHYQQILKDLPSIGWFEVHSENFFHNDSPAIRFLKKITEHYPISLHGVGLSLGSADGLDQHHLTRIKNMVDTMNPFLVSEHLSWGHVGGRHVPDLLPVPYTPESFDIFAANIACVQDYLKCDILIENPSSYLEFKTSVYKESEFLINLCDKTGAKLLLDVNNVYVSCQNHDWHALDYINAIPPNMVKEIHIAGHSSKDIGSEKPLLIDTHDHEVCDEVWALYEHAINRFGPTHTLLEWDAKIPNLNTLISQAKKALQYMPCTQKDARSHA